MADAAEINAVLGEGMSSRLFLEIRERLGLVYSVESYTESLDETGTITGKLNKDCGYTYKSHTEIPLPYQGITENDQCQ